MVKGHISIKRAIMGCLGALLCILFCVVLPSPAALQAAAESVGSTGRSAMMVLGTVFLAICWWAGAVISDWMVALLLQCLWVIMKITDVSGAFSSYTNSTVWLFVGVFCITTAVNRTGLIRRIALKLMQHFPPTFLGQVLALLTVGLICSPLIPSATAKMILGATMACIVADAMEYPAEASGRYGLFLAAVIGFGFLCPAFKTAGTNGYAMLAILPQELQQRATFLYWLACMLPWLVIVAGGMLLFILTACRPSEKRQISGAYIRQKLDEMGKPSKDEKKIGVILGVCLLLWIFENILHIDATTVSLCGALACFLLGVLEPNELSTSVPWPLIVFLGGALNIGILLKQVGINKWLQELLLPIFSIVDNTWLLILVVAVSVMLLRLLLISLMATITLTMTVLLPVFQAVGICPLGIGFVIYATMLCWFTPYQNLVFLPAFNCMQNTISHRGTIKACFVYEMLSLTAFLISVPYWKWLGCI